MKSILEKDWFYSILSAVLCFLVSFPFLGTYFVSPNTHMYVFGGDGLTLYYDIAYHICHGHGDRLTNMNYPYGEMVYLTDAQGAISTLLQWNNRNIFDICDCAVGAIHLINSILILICAVVIYYLLRAYNVSKLISVIFSVSITLLSPQMIRISGHFGLAYPFLIPLAMLWINRKWVNQKWEIRDFLFLLLLIFFTFNNPYIGIGAIGLILASSIFFLFTKNYKLVSKLVIIGIIAILIPTLYFKFFDTVTDRIRQQWGYFFYQASIDGLYAPNGSLMYQFYKKFFNFEHKPQIESWINLGMVTILLLFIFAAIKLFRLDKKKILKFDKPLIFITLGSIIMYAFAAGWFFLPFSETMIEEKFGSLLMFKAVARLAWPVYFGLSVFAAVFFYELTKERCKCCLYIPLVVFILMNLWEIHDYIVPTFDNKYHANFFSKSNNEQIKDLLKAGNVDIDQYQALLCIPKQMFWSDNQLSDINFNCQFYSNRISLATGIPLINSMLSRVSVGQSSEAIELISNPLIEKSLPKKFPNQKDILLLLGAEHLPLTEGEIFLTEISDTILKNEHFTLFRLPLNKLNDNKYIKEAKNTPETDKSKNNIIYNGFNDNNSNIKYFGNGAKVMEKGEHIVFEGTINDPTDSIYQFSCWTHIDNEKYGMGDFRLMIINEKNETLYDKNIETRRSSDIHDDWIRSEDTFKYQKGQKIKLLFNCNRTLTLDELLIRPKNQHIKLELSNSSFLYNGFKIFN